MGYAAKLFSWCLKSMEYLGYLDESKRSRAYLLISVPTLTILPAAYNICFNWTGLGNAIYDIFIIMNLITTVTRAFAVITHQKKFADTYKDIDNWYNDLEHDDDKRTFYELQKFTKRTVHFSKYIQRCSISAAAFVSFQPILTQYGNFVISIAVPGVDLLKSPSFEIIYLLQAFWVIPVCAYSYIPSVNSFLILMSFGTFMLKDLQQRINNLSQMNEESALKNIKKCVQCHMKIINFHDDLEELFSATNLLDVGIYCIIMCMLLIYSTMEFDLALILKGFLILFVQTVAIFQTFYLANDFSDESLAIASAAYNTNWTQRDVKFRKYVLLIITRSQTPLQFTAGGFKPLTMEIFLRILRISYSLFSCLKGTM
ncbi:odorant receptor Or2-like [Anastrepha obliqua]|uniref:odorant receptor Or2-like n=1 Tax=Anastrepha obliqua TaxID=95512 RepID=UPI00240A77BE|nr:odorant receptor Or2-like [Anastrepha obliqua]